MPRNARRKSETGIYHIMMRGINRQCIFEDEEDCEKILQTLEKYREKSGYEIYAYCLMGNHLHLLLKVGKEPFEQVMRRICGSYVYWYNLKYNRIGNLFQDRFKSEPVEDEKYFLTVLRYIHQNPLKAGLIKDLSMYEWSSYLEYISKARLVKTAYVLESLNKDRDKAIKIFMEYNNALIDDMCLDIDDKNRTTDEEAKIIIKKVCKVNSPTELQSIDNKSRNEYLSELKNKFKLSIRQLERLTGINRGIISRA